MSAARKLSFLVLFVVLCTPVFSQGISDTKDGLYSKALLAGVAEMQKQWGHIDDSYDSRIRTDYHHLIVRKNPEVTEDLPARAGDFNFEYLDDATLLARYKNLGKGFSILEVHPIHDKGATLRISIAQNWVSSHHGRLMFGISDWADVEFRFDCQQQAFVISNVKLGGI
jgi:hypothetical protein